MMLAPQHSEVSTDHLGNVRATVSDMLIPRGSVVFDADLRTLTDYYPFGMTMPGRSYEAAGIDGHRYGYNGKENDNEVKGEGNQQDYGFRIYDPRVARFLSTDLKAIDAPDWSPYRAFFDNPISFVDPNGLFEIETGKIEKGDNLTMITTHLNSKFKLNLTVEQVAKANNITDVDKIKAGELIKLPGVDIELNFDLTSLKVVDASYGVDLPNLEWGGTSGRAGYQNSKYQNLKNMGPIPEGTYVVDPQRTQSIEDISWVQRVYGAVGSGEWPGLESSWGKQRTWLTPIGQTTTFGRSGFTIHGGYIPGSAGCIDLTCRNEMFHNWLKSYGKPLVLTVKYSDK